MEKERTEHAEKLCQIRQREREQSEEMERLAERVKELQQNELLLNESKIVGCRQAETIQFLQD